MADWLVTGALSILGLLERGEWRLCLSLSRCLQISPIYWWRPQSRFSRWSVSLLVVPPHVARFHSQLKRSAEIMTYSSIYEARFYGRGVPVLVYLDLWGPSCQLDHVWDDSADWTWLVKTHLSIYEMTARVSELKTKAGVQKQHQRTVVRHSSKISLQYWRFLRAELSSIILKWTTRTPGRLNNLGKKHFQEPRDPVFWWETVAWPVSLSCPPSGSETGLKVHVHSNKTITLNHSHDNTVQVAAPQLKVKKVRGLIFWLHCGHRCSKLN